ncbi:S1 family peptidase [Saccharomonospora cyanea]|uniref:Secreted trypsin-like serine protease n=1 Tax=Saccharomonospora cyanea NA-134 TaxID=882082 RepID=H5XQM4_9PSEU|nr:serine protease [Saccharomonospora cyanea]EHR60084.1 secreted trypsin-like serine protease [Saccharomonospora cyanea NA-134]
MLTNIRRRLGVALTVLSGAVCASAGHAAGMQPIVGGESVSLEDYPYAVYLVDDRGNQYCGGTVISATEVLTAAHCALAVRESDLGVVVGRERIASNQGEEVGVDDVWVAPGYRDPLSGDDIAVLTLSESVSAPAARLPRSSDDHLYEPGTMATVVGWGRLFENGPKPGSLRAADVPLVSDSECSDVFRSFDADTMVCAGHESGGVDACQGDSGGPLLVDGTVIGIVSWGAGCAEPGTPGVYTRMSTYADDVRADLVRSTGD